MLEEDKLIDYWTKEDAKADISPRYNDYANKRLFNSIIKDYENKKMLDIGCGYGDLMLYFKNKGAEVVGVDLGPENIKKAKEKNLLVHEGDCRNLKFSDNYFDIVYSVGVIEHLKNQQKAIDEHVRVIKEGGICIVIVPYLFTPVIIPFTIWNMFRENIFKYGFKVVIGNLFSKNKLKKMLKKAGCKDAKIYTYSTCSILRVFTKKLNLELAEKLENSFFNKRFGFLLFGVGYK